MSFCGPCVDPDGPRVPKECLADGLYLIPHIILVAIALPNMIYQYRKLRNNENHQKNWVRYPGHDFRWILTFILIFLQVANLVEGVLSDALYEGIHLHLYIPYTVGILASIFSIVFYTFLEWYNQTKFLLVLFVYWGVATAFRIIKLVVLFQLGLGGGQMRFSLVWADLVVHALLFLIDVIVLYKQRYLLKSQRYAVSPPELQDVDYVHPYTNFLSHATWQWLSSLLVKGYKKPIEMEDLGNMPESELAVTNYRKLNSAFEEEKARVAGTDKQPSLWWSYWKAFWPMIVVGGIFKLLADQLMFVGPMCLDGMVTFVMNYQVVNQTKEVQYVSSWEYITNGYVLTIICLAAHLLQASFMQNHFFLSVRQGIRVKGAIQAMVFEKSLRLSSFVMSDEGMSQGKIMNHMSVDPLHLLWCFYLGHWSWTLPIQVTVAFGLLYIQLGFAGLASIAVIFLVIPVQYFVGVWLAKVQKNLLDQSDIRLKKSNELLQSIKLLKLYAWESVFCRSVEESRKREVRCLVKAAALRVFSCFVNDSAPLMATLMTFTLYPYIENKPLAIGKVFSGLAIFNILALPLFVVTMIINLVAHARVSTARLLPYFLAQDLDESPLLKAKEDPKGKDEDEDKDIDDKDVKVRIVQPTKASNEDMEMNQPEKADSDKPEDDADEKDKLLGKEHEEAEEDEKDMVDADEKDEDIAVEIKGGSFSWDKDGKNMILEDINIKIPFGKLTIIVGQVGSGKSSILQAMLGEMITVKGSVHWNKNAEVAYGAQKAWLMNNTVRGNILFADEYDESRYENILDVCALRPDLAILPAGDHTEIGEKGINMSGGQKQRVSIARTMYSQANVVMLDDPLSALDVHVGGHIMEKGIQNFLRKSKRTTILVTHQLQYLNKADQLIVMKEGKVLQQGTLKQIKQQDPDLYNSWKASVQQARSEETEEAPSDPQVTSTPKAKFMEPLRVEATPLTRDLQDEGLPLRSYWSYPSLAGSRASLFDLVEETGEPLTQRDKGGEKELEDSDDENAEGKLIQAEEREMGQVKLKVYLHYMKASAYWIFILTVVFYIVRQGFRIWADYWLAEWCHESHTQQEGQFEVAPPGTTNGTSYDIPKDKGHGYDLYYYVTRYVLLCSLTFLGTFLAVAFVEFTCLTAAINLHNKMLRRLIYAPMRFFDTTPLGRILNRLAGDTNIIDEKMPVTLDSVFFCLFLVLGGIVVNAISTPYFLIPAIPMVIIFFAIQRFYITTCRELQRLDSITKSPVLAHFSETLGGLATVRAFCDQKRFRNKSFKSIDDNNTAFLYLHTANVWMGIRLDYLAAGIVFTASVSSITSGLYGSATVGIVAMSITYAIMVSSYLNWMMRNISEGEMWFNAVERVAHYTKIAIEPYHKEKEVIPNPSWPKDGAVRFSNVSLRYDKSLDPVIRELSVEVRAGEKVGICGRTGSGKSSLTLGLFRIIDICEGTITIDEIDISLVPLETLRSKLSIIPQDPVLFEGTIRFNLDPDNKIKNDEDVWKALEIAQLKAVIMELPEKLEAPVTEGGENFSVGQRQLFCLARAFLKNSRILIMDEATASIDMETDAIIQEVIKTVFKDRTVLTIAHRVATILNSDSIIVLQDGEIIEHDAPQSLLGQADSVFASMVRDNK